jgi:alpha-glucosidase (family GH31 glycosyl hydrolase)
MIYTQSFPIQFDPIADPQAIVRAPQARFTVLTERLLRLEYDPAEAFEDRPSQAFWRRRQPVPEYSSTQNGGLVEIETAYLQLRYQASAAGFTPQALSIRLKETGADWHYGADDPWNLLGTARTLDNISGALALEQGLISRSGWAVYDDSQRLVFKPDGWLTPRQAAPGYHDLYFFGYGMDYTACQRDFRKISGPVPLLPRWALGNWWSRYWAYSADELLALMDEFKAHQTPLSVCIVDMDWHLTETGNTSSGWTGYTWNRELFPDPPAFIAALHQRGLRTALNLHPAEGVHPHEDQYPAMAARLGIDPKSGEPIRFDVADPEFTRAYFELLHHPMEAQGIDFWWLDWQQGTLSGLPGLDPLWWLNHLHFYDLGREGAKRPFIFSRWGGLGNHRYPIGFSGDAHVTWESLAFQPYFTATAANVGYGWWSHDIGGHMSGIEDPELYTRWVQFGVFSPILRMHSTNNPFHERRPWSYDAETARVARQALQLRHALIPYLYSMSWRDHRDGLQLVRPMYHAHPEQEAAYHCPDQYLFGSELLAAPFVAPKDPQTRLSRQLVWLPQGQWFDFFDSARYPSAPHGGTWHAVYGGLEQIPVFARAGAIVPLAPRAGWGGVDNPESLEIHLFPGAENSFELYEDDGGEDHSLTPIHSAWSDGSWKIQIGPAQGATAHLPAERSYSLLLRALNPNAAVSAWLNGAPLELGSAYDALTATLRVRPVTLRPEDSLVVQAERVDREWIAGQDYRLEMCRRMLRAFPMESWSKMHLDTSLADILADVDRLAEFGIALSESQLRAFLEVLCGAGMQRMPLRRQAGEETILWNNHAMPEVRYQLVYTRSFAGPPVRRSGPLPAFAVLGKSYRMLHFLTAESRARRFSQASDWLQALPRRLEIKDGAELNGVVQFDVRGQGGFQAYFLVQDGLALTRSGLHKQPSATLRAESADFLALVNGEATPVDLHTSGKLNVEGNLSLLLAFYQGLAILPQDQFLADDWRIQVDYLDILRL